MTAAGYPLLEAGTVVAHVRARGLLDRLGPADPAALSVREVSDGNLNRIFLVRRHPDEPGLAVKQAMPWIRVQQSWPLTPDRALAEARAYGHLMQVAPDLIPVLHDVDEATFTLVMEDVGQLEVLRTASVAGDRPGGAGARIGEFVARLAFATSDFGMASGERKALAAASSNPELCLMTEDVVLTEPYLQHEHNWHHPGVDTLVRSMRADLELLTAVSTLKHTFMTKAEALIHGDLHSGSVMVGDGRVAVIDPEFSFTGPVGFDLGLSWANALIAAVRAHTLGDRELAAEHAGQVGDGWDAFRVFVRAAWPTRVDHSFTDAYREFWFSQVWADALGFAGVEAVRRVAGYSHAADIETLPEPGRVRATAWVLTLAQRLILGRHDLADPAQVLALLEQIIDVPAPAGRAEEHA